jgi:hypothetical protein
MPPTATAFDTMKAAANDNDPPTLYYKNTKSIEFFTTSTQPNMFRRVYWELRASGLEEAVEERAVPDNSVIFVTRVDPIPAGVDTLIGGTNASTWLNNRSLEFRGGTIGTVGSPDEGARVTLGFEGQIELVNTVRYQTLLENPDLRRIENKQTAAALGYREMLGVVAGEKFIASPGVWSALPASQSVSGHLPQQFPLDGVFMSLTRLQGNASSPTPSLRELWLNGGLISGSDNLDPLTSHFGVLNYHTDYRLQYTMPPYFLRAFGDYAVFEKGTWRTYEKP